MIKEIMDTPLAEGDIAGAMEKLSKIQAIHGLSAECLSWAEKYTLQKQKTLLPALFSKGLNATSVRMELECEMAEEKALYTLAERLNAALVHVGDEIRTIISRYKQEQFNSR